MDRSLRDPKQLSQHFETEYPSLSCYKDLSTRHDKGKEGHLQVHRSMGVQREKGYKLARLTNRQSAENYPHKQTGKFYKPTSELWCFSFVQMTDDDFEDYARVNTMEEGAFWEENGGDEEIDELSFISNKKYGQRSKRANKRGTSYSLLRDKCFLEKYSKSILKGRSSKKVVLKSDVANRRDRRKDYVQENWKMQKRNIDRSLISRGLTRGISRPVEQQIDIAALEAAMPSTASQQRQSRDARMAQNSSSKRGNIQVNSRSKKQRHKARHNSNHGNRQPQKYELHESNIKNNAQNGTEEDVLFQLMNIQHRELTPEDYELLLRLDESIAPKTLNESVLKKLPIKTIDEVLLEEISEMHCTVCLDEFCVGQKLKYLNCGHCFHGNCIDNWLLSCDTKCPLDGIPVT